LIGEVEGSNSMSRVLLGALSGLACCLSLSTAALASGPDPADYPLRIRIVHYNFHRPDMRESKAEVEGMPDMIDGEGHADLFENGEPRAFEFTNSCIEPLYVAYGYETLDARWKKQNKVLEVLVPGDGKRKKATTWTTFTTCELHTSMKSGIAYLWKADGSVVEVPSQAFKDWMVKWQYDPEKGKNLPVKPDADPAGKAGQDSSQPGSPAPAKPQ
jgi:hypothetical protein